MGYYRPKSKFEYYFTVIGERLYYGLFILAIIVYDCFIFYQLITGDWKSIDIVFSMVSVGFSVMGVNILFHNIKDRRIKNKTEFKDEKMENENKKLSKMQREILKARIIREANKNPKFKESILKEKQTVKNG